MNKDVSLIMRRTILTYTYILFTIFILKLCGLDYFGIDMSSPFIVFLDNILGNGVIKTIVNMIFIMIYQHIMLSLIVNDKPYKMTIISTPITYLVQSVVKQNLIPYGLSIFSDIIYLFILCLVYNKIYKTKKPIVKRFLIVIILNILFQAISTLTRYRYSVEYVTSISMNIILNIDYLILMLMAYKLYFMKGDVRLCGKSQVVVGSFLQKLASLRKQLKSFQIKFSKISRKEKFETILYLSLLFIWNVFTLAVVIFIAKLNNTVVECIFILSSFWINKHSFGKPFHLKNALHCFIVSNLAYYCLNRITLPLGISIMVSIILGILLAWFTSKLVRSNKKPLYRGMSEDELRSKLDRIDADPIDYEICKYYYVNGYSEVKVAAMTYYSVENIKKRKRNINDRLKELII